MKRIVFLFLVMIAMSVMAQERTTTLHINGRKLVIKEYDGKIKVKMYEANAENDTIENTQVFEGVYLDGRSIERTTTVSVPFVKKIKDCYRFEPHYPVFYFGGSKLANGKLQYSTGVPQRQSGSWEWGINLFNTGVTITRNNHWGLTTTLGFSRIVYKLDNNYGFEKTDGITVCRQSEDIDYEKSWLRYWAFRLPISLEWQTKYGSRHAFIAAGPEVEWRVGIRSRAKYDNKNHTLSSNLNAHPLGMNLLLQAGYGCIGFNARFALTPLFEKNKGPELYPASIGVGFYW